MMYKELKKAIIMWLLEHENEWCREAFKEYIYNVEGNYLIGGKDVSDFITAADELLYKQKIQ